MTTSSDLSLSIMRNRLSAVNGFLFFLWLVACFSSQAFAAESSGGSCAEDVSIDASLVREILENEWSGGGLFRSYPYASGVLLVEMSDLGPGLVEVKAALVRESCGTIVDARFVFVEPADSDPAGETIDEVKEWEEDDMSQP